MIEFQPQHGLPDILLWLISNGKRVAYHRICARDALFSTTEEECGTACGKVQTVFLKVNLRFLSFEKKY